MKSCEVQRTRTFFIPLCISFTPGLSLARRSKKGGQEPGIKEGMHSLPKALVRKSGRNRKIRWEPQRN